MARRRALTGGQLAELLALPSAEPDLIRHWTLSASDLVVVGRRRGGRNRLGFALQLCALRYPGWLLRPSEPIPAEALRFVAEQLGTEPEGLAAYAALDSAPELALESVTRLEFRNGSRVIGLPGAEKTIRGYSGAGVVLIDEAARVDDALIAAVKPTQATVKNGRFIAMTTPAGRRGWFFEQWTRGEGWHRIKVTAAQCPRHDGAGGFRVSKVELTGWLSALLHAGELRIARELPLAAALVDELQDFRVGFTAGGTSTFGASAGRHDDLVLAVGLAVWRAAERPQSGVSVIDLPW